MSCMWADALRVLWLGVPSGGLSERRLTGRGGAGGSCGQWSWCAPGARSLALHGLPLRVSAIPRQLWGKKPRAGGCLWEWLALSLAACSSGSSVFTFQMLRSPVRPSVRSSGDFPALSLGNQVQMPTSPLHSGQPSAARSRGADSYCEQLRPMKWSLHFDPKPPPWNPAPRRPLCLHHPDAQPKHPHRGPYGSVRCMCFLLFFFNKIIFN